MGKRITDVERLISFALNASEETLSSTIQTLTAIRNNKFPTEKKSRKSRKSKESTPKATDPAPAPRAARSAKTPKNDADPEAVARKCTSCGWEGFSIHPEPCPDCGEKTESK